MAKSAVFGLASGLAVVVLTMIVVAVVNLPQTSDAASGDAPRCHEIAQDQGYGLVRPVRHEDCRSTADRG